MGECFIAPRVAHNLRWGGAVGSHRPVEPVDLWAEVRKLWREPDERFLSGLYALLFLRAPDAAGLASHLGALAGGCPRAKLVRGLALSEEVRAGRLDVSWLPWLAQL